MEISGKSTILVWGFNSPLSNWENNYRDIEGLNNINPWLNWHTPANRILFTYTQNIHQDVPNAGPEIIEKDCNITKDVLYFMK